MSVQAITWAIEQNIPAAGQKLVLIALSNYASRVGVCFPGQEALAKDTSQGIRTVRRHLTSLEQAGFIDRTRRSRADGTRTSDEYQLNMPAAKMAGSEERQPANISKPTGQIGRAILEPSVNQEDSIPPVVPPLSDSQPIENQKEASNGTKPKTRNQKGTPLAPDWEPDEQDRGFASEKGFDPAGINELAAEYRDYWIGIPGQRGLKRDWPATWRNRVRDRAAYLGKRGSSPAGQGQAGASGRGDTGVVAALRQLQDS